MKIIVLLISITGLLVLQSFQTTKSLNAKKIIKDFLKDLKHIDGGTFIMGKSWDSENIDFFQ